MTRRNGSITARNQPSQRILVLVFGKKKEKKRKRKCETEKKTIMP